MKTSEFSLRLGDFLGAYLPAHRNVTANTITSYAQTFILLIRHCEKLKIPIDRMEMDHFNADTVLTFLDYLEQERGNGVATRNQRMAALRSFARYLTAHVPDRARQWERIKSIPSKLNVTQQWVMHMDISSMARLLRGPDRATPWGRRDATLLSLLYDSGIRVQEIITLTPGKVRLETPAHLAVLGKGRKGRLVPLLPATASLLKSHIDEWHGDHRESMERPLFFNHRREALTRSGIGWIIRKYTEKTDVGRVDGEKRVTPHMFRHSKAMHLLKSKASLAEIQSLLGHADIRTTMRYAHADEQMVREAMLKSGTAINKEAGKTKPSWKRERDLLVWLKGLCNPAL